MTRDEFRRGTKVSNYEKDATGATALWPTDKLYKVICPVGKRVYLLGGSIYRAVSSTLVVTVKDASDDIIMYMSYKAAATGNTGFPESAFTGNAQIILDDGEYISAVFGTSQNANSYASCNWIEVMHQ